MALYRVTTDELYHHGILGQKWGVRRYQNPDGSLTPAGRKRYAKEVTKHLNELSRAKTNAALLGHEVYSKQNKMIDDYNKKVTEGKATLELGKQITNQLDVMDKQLSKIDSLYKVADDEINKYIAHLESEGYSYITGQANTYYSTTDYRSGKRYAGGTMTTYNVKANETLKGKKKQKYSDSSNKKTYEITPFQDVYIWY